MNSDCQDVRELMDSYLSEELSVETNHRVLRHLANCQACSAESTRRQRMRSLLAQSFDAPPDLDGARQRIMEAVQREQRSWGRGTRWLGVAAAILIAAIATATWMARPVDVAAYDDSAADHVACALAYYPEGATYDAARVARNLAAPFEQIADRIGLSHGAYHVIDAHMCPYKGRDYAHVVIRGQGQTLSIFAERALRGSLPAASSTAALGSEALDVLSTTRLGYQVSAVATPEHRVFLVSEQQTAPPEIGNEILLSAVRFVREIEK